ncbi:hypothetical protein TH19_11935 [Thalassospira profundimaris]|uniref:Uncharacterized protein n=1 Tax=Thalassospira profundimaris TaxID=502049 RepID=A0A367W5F9_9PROT|nr:hypothetical protein TH19_11935 [Thalassospira profundimaris]
MRARDTGDKITRFCFGKKTTFEINGFDGDWGAKFASRPDISAFAATVFWDGIYCYWFTNVGRGIKTHATFDPVSSMAILST